MSGRDIRDVEIVESRALSPKRRYENRRDPKVYVENRGEVKQTARKTLSVEPTAGEEQQSQNVGGGILKVIYFARAARIALKDVLVCAYFLAIAGRSFGSADVLPTIIFSTAKGE